LTQEFMNETLKGITQKLRKLTSEKEKTLCHFIGYVS
jgi:hypothetical protein